MDSFLCSVSSLRAEVPVWIVLFPQHLEQLLAYSGCSLVEHSHVKGVKHISTLTALFLLPPCYFRLYQTLPRSSVPAVSSAPGIPLSVFSQPLSTPQVAVRHPFLQEVLLISAWCLTEGSQECPVLPVKLWISWGWEVHLPSIYPGPSTQLGVAVLDKKQEHEWYEDNQELPFLEWPLYLHWFNSSSFTILVHPYNKPKRSVWLAPFYR